MKAKGLEANTGMLTHLANELALRATANGSINTHALQSVLSAIQSLITQRQPLIT